MAENKGSYLLVVDGSIPVGNPAYRPSPGSQTWTC
jgi:hypothetical protein